MSQLKEEVLHIAESVCDTLLDVKVSVRDCVRAPGSLLTSSGSSPSALPTDLARHVQTDLPKNEHTVSRQVRLKGGWNGSVKVECSEPLARHAASVTFGGAPQDATDDELNDVVGEIANMVGGNMKALMPGPTQLTLPETPLDLGDLGTDESSQAKKPSLVLQLEARGEPLTVSVYKDED